MRSDNAAMNEPDGSSLRGGEVADAFHKVLALAAVEVEANVALRGGGRRRLRVGGGGRARGRRRRAGASHLCLMLIRHRAWERFQTCPSLRGALRSGALFSVAQGKEAWASGDGERLCRAP